MRTFIRIMTPLAVFSASACVATNTRTTVADQKPKEILPETETSIANESTNAVYLVCRTDNERTYQPTITYRINPDEGTWSWLREGIKEGEPIWEVGLCASQNHDCSFEAEMWNHNWRDGVRYMELISINRMTGLMEMTTYTDSDGVQKWEYMCTPADLRSDPPFNGSNNSK